MPFLKIRYGLGLVLALALARAVVAVDTVVLTTGDTLRGEVIEQTDDHIVLRHAILGELTISVIDIELLTLEPEPPAEAPD